MLAEVQVLQYLFLDYIGRQYFSWISRTVQPRPSTVNVDRHKEAIFGLGHLVLLITPQICYFCCNDDIRALYLPMAQDCLGRPERASTPPCP